MSVIIDVCFRVGHKIQSLQKSGPAVFDPVSKQVIPIFEHICTQCGRTREECINYKPSGGGSRSRKKKSNEHSPNTHEAGIPQNPEVGTESV